MVKKVIKFGAAWCGPCKAYKPNFEAVSKNEKFNDIIFSEIDVDNATDEEDELIQKNNVRNIPLTLLLDENDNTVKKLVGALSIDELTEEIEKTS